MVAVVEEDTLEAVGVGLYQALAAAVAVVLLMFIRLLLLIL